LSRESPLKVSDFDFIECIGKGCNSVVYKARPVDGDDTQVKQEFAIKMMFNYDAESNAMAIWKAMNKECIPYDGSFGHLDPDMENLLATNRGKGQRKTLKSHPCIVKIRAIFTDYTPHLPDALKLYPNALPARIYEQGYGRNMTLFLVMDKYDKSLSEYLKSNFISPRTSLYLTTQLFEAIAFLVENGIAHRDLKSDNILLDLRHGDDQPWLVVSDFGFCSTELRVPFPTDDVMRGGNRALMAPEIITASPGQFSNLDFSASDIWAAATIVYEIFGANNPFYPDVENPHKSPLYNVTYSEDDLPSLPCSAPEPVQNLVRDLLRRNPRERPKPTVAANVCHMALEKMNGNLPEKDDWFKWITEIAVATLFQCRSMRRSYAPKEEKDNPKNSLTTMDWKLRLLWLSRIDYNSLVVAGNYF